MGSVLLLLLLLERLWLTSLVLVAHSFAGIGLGKGSGQQLFRSMSKYAKARWKSVK